MAFDDQPLPRFNTKKMLAEEVFQKEGESGAKGWKPRLDFLQAGRNLASFG